MRTLTCDPVLHCDDIMVVFEGKDRLILHRGEGEQWRVRALWPEPPTSGRCTPTSARAAPSSSSWTASRPSSPCSPRSAPVRPGARTSRGQHGRRGAGRVPHPPAGLAAAALRSRGLDHLQECERLLAHYPHPLLPPLLVAPPRSDAPHVRFAYRTGSAAISASHMAKAASYLFGDPEEAADVPCPPVPTHR